MSALYAKNPTERRGDDGAAARAAAAAPLAAHTRGVYRALSASSVGLELGIAVILGLLFGRWLDGKAGTDPWLTLLFVVLGFVAGMKGVMRAVRVADRDAAASDAAAAAATTAATTEPAPTELRREAGR